MSRTTYFLLTWSLAVWAVLAALVFAPTPLRGQEPTLPALPSLEVVPPANPLVGSCDTPDYWIVSSRESVQHRLRKREDWKLDVFHRHVGGQTVASSLGDLGRNMAPGVPVLICIHGSFVDWESNFKESAEAYQWIRRAAPHLPLQVIFFSWPSDGPYTHITPLDVAIRGERAEFNGFHVAQVVASLPESCPVSFLGHSHGCRVILSALHIAGGGVVQDLCFRYDLGQNRRYRVVLAAAAVDHNWLNPGERYDHALVRCEALLTLINREDLPIAVYPLHRPGALRALSRVGLTDRDRRLLGGQAVKASEFDVTCIVGRDHLWPGYYRCPQIATSIAPYVYFQDARTTQAMAESFAAPAEPIPLETTLR